MHDRGFKNFLNKSKRILSIQKIKISSNKALCHDLIGSVFSFLVVNKITVHLISNSIFNVMKHETLICCQTYCILVYTLSYYNLLSLLLRRTKG